MTLSDLKRTGTDKLKTLGQDAAISNNADYIPPHAAIDDEKQREDVARIEAHVKRVEGLARLMDSQFKIPGVPFNLGLDTIIGFIPGLGDTIGLGISAYIISQSAHVGVSRATLIQMIGNVGLDWLVGLIPIIGDIFDWGWKANNRNAALLRDHWDSVKPPDMIDVTEMAGKLNKS